MAEKSFHMWMRLFQRSALLGIIVATTLLAAMFLWSLAAKPHVDADVFGCHYRVVASAGRVAISRFSLTAEDEEFNEISLGLLTPLALSGMFLAACLWRLLGNRRRRRCGFPVDATQLAPAILRTPE